MGSITELVMGLLCPLIILLPLGAVAYIFWEEGRDNMVRIEGQGPPNKVLWTTASVIVVILMLAVSTLSYAHYFLASDMILGMDVSTQAVIGNVSTLMGVTLLTVMAVAVLVGALSGDGGAIIVLLLFLYVFWLYWKDT